MITPYHNTAQLAPIQHQQPGNNMAPLAEKLRRGKGQIITTTNGTIALSFPGNGVMFIHHATSAADITDQMALYLKRLAQSQGASKIEWDSEQNNLALSKMYIRLGAAIMSYDGTHIRWRMNV